jgi:predicted anti-sigma-YlaC factor YlaD
MICNRARRLFGVCWDDELTQAERDGLESHLASCPPCRTEYDKFSRALELTAALPRLEASADFVERVLVRSRRATTAPDLVREAGSRWVPVAVAAAGAVLVVAAVLVGSNLQWKVPASAPMAQILPVGGPTEARIVVPKSSAKPGKHSQEARRGNAENLFDSDKNIEFVLDPAQVSGGRVKRDPEGQRPIITF